MIAPTEPVSPERRRAIELFLFGEARLLDEGRYADWLALLTDDAVYWVPSRPDQTDPKATISIVYEDVALLALRIERLGHPRAHSLLPMPRTARLIGNVEVVEGDEESGRFRVASAFHASEYRAGERRLFSGRAEHRLCLVDGALRIAFKRVDLLDADAAHGVISILL